MNFFLHSLKRLATSSIFLIITALLLNSFFFAAQQLSDEKTVDLENLFKRARDLAFQENRKEAIEICKCILEKKPDYQEVRVFLGRLYAWDKDYNSAWKELKRVIQDNPGSLDALSALIDVEYWSGNIRSALDLCDECLTDYPSNEDFLLKKARILTDQAEYKKASEILNLLLIINPSNTEALQLSERIQFSYRQYEISLNYRLDDFERGEIKFGPWHLFSIDFTQRQNFGSIIGRVNYASLNFGSGFKPGTQFEIDFYPNITKGLYAYLNGGYSSSSVFSKYRLGSELYVSLPSGFEISGGARYLDFSGSSVLIYTGYMGKYFKKLWLSFRPFLASKPSGSSFSGILLARRYLENEDNFIGLLVGFGSSFLKSSFLEDIERKNSYRIGLEVQRMISRTSLIRFNIQFEREEFRPNTFGNRITLEIRLQQLFYKKY